MWLMNMFTNAAKTDVDRYLDIEYRDESKEYREFLKETILPRKRQSLREFLTSV